MVVVLVYVDDLLITGDNANIISASKGTLHQQFELKDLGELKYFLGIEVLRSASGVKLNQRKYIFELISNIGLAGAKPTFTPLETNIKLKFIEVDEATGVRGYAVLKDMTSYQRLIGKLIYATITRPDISYAVQTLSQYMQQPKKSHLEDANRAQPTAELLCWFDSDWAAYPNTRRSITGYVELKAEHMRPGGLLQRLLIFEWKWNGSQWTL
ncbi:uncharacterized mitochondrial protein AtMg00810-like [Capsicum annuum]|uniref:uncharacterized mitochondrial protein AtMg00810-like n=1 Tax=Capsicum annuum TaxID=4072 RepID=UPI001FB19D80|nr:uncharacterized mitochondrial protein AtMg00810-like [Capsicum annuum]